MCTAEQKNRALENVYIKMRSGPILGPILGPVPLLGLNFVMSYLPF